MCQREILAFLKQNPEREWDLHQICLYNGLRDDHAAKALNKLRKYNEVCYRIVKQSTYQKSHHKKFIYSFKP